MSKKIRVKITLPLMLFFLLSSFLRFAAVVKADEIIISGNGDSSSNTATVSSSNEVTVVQNNGGDVQNNVDQSANTGGNSASDNTGGGVGITSGDSSLSTTIQNSLNNSSVDANTCCNSSDISANITGNGAGSTNSVDLAVSQSNNVYVSQNANVSNYIEGTGVTGRNSAENNTGSNIFITTGDILATVKIKNGPANISAVTAGNPAFNFSAIISGNGENSVNKLEGTLDDPLNVTIKNSFEAKNKTIWNLVTGENRVDGNTGGKVNITTGDIFLSIWLETVANISDVHIDCCKDNTPPPGPAPTPSPTPNPYDPGGSSSSGSPLSPAGWNPGGAGPSVLGLSYTGSQSESLLVLLAGLAMIIGGAILISKEYGKKEYFAFR